MKLGYVFLYVDDVEASLGFFEKAFGLPRRFYHESGYGDGVEKDLVQAHVLYNVAAIIGSAQGVKLRAAVEEKLRLDQIDTAHQNAEKWLADFALVDKKDLFLEFVPCIN